MTDLKSKKWIVAKGLMFFGIVALTGGLMVGRDQGAEGW